MLNTIYGQANGRAQAEHATNNSAGVTSWNAQANAALVELIAAKAQYYTVTSTQWVAP
jgi:hypothetical protein